MEKDKIAGKRQVSFLWESEKRIKIAKAGQDNAFFYDAYRQAMAGVTEIVRTSLMQTSRNNTDPLFFNHREFAANGTAFEKILDDEYFYNYPNNMIVFSGERGAGKSSALLSFVESLKSKDSALYTDKFLEDMSKRELLGISSVSVAQMLKSCCFFSLPPIDPTALEHSDQILTVILARMFQAASDAWRKNEFSRQRGTEQSALSQKNELIRQFSICYEHVNAIKNWDKKCQDYEGLEVLNGLGDASLLKKEFTDLTEQLLKFLCLDSPGEPYLVIQIDDTDMNIQHAYAILEDIRRYLVIPRIIIIMAADLSHLRKVVESSLLAGYHQGLGNRDKYAERIAQQYITKLFPQTRQINLPVLGTYFKEHADNIEIRYTTPEKMILPDGSAYTDVQDQIFRLIYKKTGLIFLKPQDGLHNIIPGNMRLHAHFLAMLVQMEDIEDPDAESPSFFLRTSEDGKDNTHTETELRIHWKTLLVRLQNILRFQDYFLTTWVTNRLNTEQSQLISDLSKTDIAKKVSFICRWLEQKLAPKSTERCHYQDKYYYADLVRLCHQFEAQSVNTECSVLIFAIQTYFSLLGNIITLEELVDFYGGTAEDCASSLMCSLKRLYPIYGSQIFFYQNRDTNEKPEFFVTDWKNNGNGKPLLLFVHWKLKKIPNISGPVVSFPAGQLYSLLADYDPPKTSNAIVIDLCSPITNCLYLWQRNHLEMSPLVKRLYKDESVVTESVSEKDWEIMRNSALLVTLNADVQNRIENLLLDMGKQETETDDEAEVLSYNLWTVALSEFYNKLTGTFVGDKENPTPPISALAHLKFDFWVQSLFMDTDNKRPKQFDNPSWQNVIKELNPNIKWSSSKNKTPHIDLTNVGIKLSVQEPTVPQAADSKLLDLDEATEQESTFDSD